MGADIHAYPEFSTASLPGWSGVGRLSLSRDYDLFAKLAGVRGDGQIVPTRGLPVDVSLATKWDNELYVSDKSPDSEGSCSRECAERWVNNGYSRWTDERKVSVTQPDWHSHSYCSPAELRVVLEADRPRAWSIDACYWATLAMLEEFERRDAQARLVFWFDN